MKPLYPEIDPFATHSFARDGHRIHVEECGNPHGFPALFLHGGPGSGCKAYHRGFFDPGLYRIALLDQRGCGRSTPPGALHHNTTADLLSDIEHIRRHLGADQWLIFAGSWGVTLALLYAQAHPSKVAGLILRGTFLARRRDLDWFVGENGVRQIYPDTWAHLSSQLPDDGRADPVAALHRILTGDDELAQRRAARAWEQWGGQVALGEAFDPRALNGHVASQDVVQARIELHYAANRYFIDENLILDQCHRIRHIPTTIIHGRRDLVCPVESAWSLHQRLPDSALRILPQAGHIASTDDMIDALVSATDDMAIRWGLRA
jgi:proline iminopeptidase